MPAFTIRIFKSWGARDADRRWVNTYELFSTVHGSPDAMLPTLVAIVDAERHLHLTDVQFLSGTVSTWVPDSQPYDPDAFVTQELVGHGSRGNGVPPNPTALDSNVCLQVKRQCTTGRSGKLFYRGCLLEGDVEMGGDGRFTLTAGSTIIAGGADWVAYTTAMAPFLNAAEGADALSLISAVAGGQRVRPVDALIPRGVTVNRRNHRYFDRGAHA
jgi:hypothetical protein